VLEHVIAESARVLAPGGVFVAATPNAACLSVMGHDFWRDPTHIRFYEPRLLAFYCAKAGLDVVETGGQPAEPPLAHHRSRSHRPHTWTRTCGATWSRPSRTSTTRSTARTGRAFGHFLGVLEERMRATQEELVALRRSYAHLLDRLYPSNEVYVVARAV